MAAASRRRWSFDSHLNSPPGQCTVRSSKLDTSKLAGTQPSACLTLCHDHISILQVCRVEALLQGGENCLLRTVCSCINTQLVTFNQAQQLTTTLITILMNSIKLKSWCNSWLCCTWLIHQVMVHCLSLMLLLAHHILADQPTTTAHCASHTDCVVNWFITVDDSLCCRLLCN